MRTLLFVNLLFLSIFRLPGNKTLAYNSYRLKSVDTTRYVILKYTLDRNRYIYNGDVKPTTLSNTEIQNILSLVNKRVAGYNNFEKKTKYPLFINHPEKYFKQLIAAINSKGEKIVWVNCFCEIDNFTYWRKSIVSVMDGGTCFFQLKINLATNRVFYFWVNSVA